MAEEKKEIIKTSDSDRFVDMVLKEAGTNSISVTDYQKELLKGYFIKIDRALKMYEEARPKKNENNKDHKYDNNDPCNWGTIDQYALALDLMSYSKLGLDMMQDNMLAPVIFKDNNRETKSGTKMYTVNLMKGYNGIRYIAEKYALRKPVNVTCELVYSTDTFTVVKKDRTNDVEAYTFQINNPFDRGDIVGGFGYIEYKNPKDNKLVFMTIKDILKRKPKYASPEFWGGTKKEYKDGKMQEVEVEGWYDEMCLKTLKREVYKPKNIPIDPTKIDEAYRFIKMQELKLAELEADAEIDANSMLIDVDIQSIKDDDKNANMSESEGIAHD